MGKTSFAPIKTEVKGHVKSLKAKHLSNTEKFQKVTDIIQDEILTKKSQMPHSATSALVWIMRHLMFLHFYLRSFVESEDSVLDCLKLAYESTLMMHHDQVIQNVFAVSLLLQSVEIADKLYV